MSTRRGSAGPALVAAGQARIAWAGEQMPVLAQVRERFGVERPLDGVGVALCLHVTAETGNLILALLAGGAQVTLCAANPFSTQDDVAAALAKHPGAAVHASRGEGVGAHARNLAAAVAAQPRILIDDGAELIGAAHGDATAEGLLGAIEETSTGLVRLRALAAQGELRCAVLAANEALSERAFNDRYGTGQSTLDGILRATNLLFAGRTLVVLGYGNTGKGIALRARGAGAQVIVCEVDPIAALEARMEGYEVMPAEEAAARGDIFVTVTGAPGVLRREHFQRMKDGAVLANAGHFDVEISLPELLAAAAGPPRQVLPLVEQYELPGRRLNLLAAGRVVNLAAAAGHPAAVMDISFAVQALCAQHITQAGLSPGVHPVPVELDRQVAQLKLESLGLQIDQLSSEQERYLRSWRA